MGDGTDRPAQCQLTTLRDALARFAKSAPDGHQGAAHIKPFHWYVASRLVVEGGFHPDEVVPRPPFQVEVGGAGSSARHLLRHDASAGRSGERTLLGGLKTKDVDVVACKDGIGPVIAVSMKGTLNAFRNLTNRMEEAVGDCTNLHLAYPALVYGFLHLTRANPQGDLPEEACQFLIRDRHARAMPVNDIAIDRDGKVTAGILRYHGAMSKLAGRQDTRESETRYEAVALLLANALPSDLGTIYHGFPPDDSPLRFDTFFERLYEEYDKRFVYAAPELRKVTARREWDADSPALRDPVVVELNPRVRT